MGRDGTGEIDGEYTKKPFCPSFGNIPVALAEPFVRHWYDT